MRTLTATPITPGTFSAIASPWVDSALKRTELATFKGTAVVIASGASYQIMLCDLGQSRWQGAFTLLVKDYADKKSPFEYDATIPGTNAVLVVNGRGVTVGGPPRGGSIKATIDPMKSVKGIARLHYPNARLPYATAPDTIDVGVSFNVVVSPDPVAAAMACVPRGRRG